jgi:hypothetical protein
VIESIDVAWPSMARARRYFINLFTEETWRESRLNARFEFTGHTFKLRNREEMQPGDAFLCWVTRVSACVGVMEITGSVYEVEHEDPPTWRRGLYPVRYPTRMLKRVALTHGVTLADIRAHAQAPALWNWIYRNSGNEIPAADAEWIVSQLDGRPSLTPDADEPSLEEGDGADRERPHVRFQAKLLQLGRSMGLDTYVARNDRSSLYESRRLGDIASVGTLPVGLPEPVRRRVELVDVIWLRRNEYIAMFEVEATTDIFKGLLRMADLITLLPNYVVPLFIVAPEDRRGAVFEQLTRPVFSMGLQRPLDEACRFIAFETFESDLETHGDRVGLFDPLRYLSELSEQPPEAA